MILIRFRANIISRAEAGPTAKGSVCPREINPNGGEGIRTPDLLNAIETRSQLRYTPGEACLLYTNGGIQRNSCQLPLKWRERVGIEPTEDGINRPPRGFEDRENHQAPSAPMRKSKERNTNN